MIRENASSVGTQAGTETVAASRQENAAEESRASEPSAEKWTALLGRMTETYKASNREAGENTAWMEERLRFVAEEARLYLRYHIPWWPPQMLVRKLVRRLFYPIVAPQIEWNEAVRDVLQETRHRNDRQRDALRDAQATIEAQEERITELSRQVETLTRLVKAGVNAPTPTPPSRNGAHKENRESVSR